MNRRCVLSQVYSCTPKCLEGAFLRSKHAPHRLSQSVLRIASHTRPFRGSAIVPTRLSFLSRALKRCLPLYTRAHAGTPQTLRSAPLYKPIMVGCVCL